MAVWLGETLVLRSKQAAPLLPAPIHIAGDFAEMLIEMEGESCNAPATGAFHRALGAQILDVEQLHWSSTFEDALGERSPARPDPHCLSRRFQGDIN